VVHREPAAARLPTAPCKAIGDRPQACTTFAQTGCGRRHEREDGGVFAFGDAPYVGALTDICSCTGLAGADLTESGYGYVIVAGDGGIFNFGDARFEGSVGSIPINSRVVDAAVRR
jgi:hypothetical protein